MPFSSSLFKHYLLYRFYFLYLNVIYSFYLIDFTVIWLVPYLFLLVNILHHILYFFLNTKFSTLSYFIINIKLSDLSQLTIDVKFLNSLHSTVDIIFSNQNFIQLCKIEKDYVNMKEYNIQNSFKSFRRAQRQYNFNFFNIQTITSWLISK